jgi:L-alanine-DL-glutamate epimerase-like enolase superfamily enzyme
MDEGIISPVEAAEFIALELFDGITMKTARCAGLWNASRIVRLIQEHNLAILASGLTDPDLSLAAGVHLFAWAGITKPCALNGPQYLANSLLSESNFLPESDVISVPVEPGLGLALDGRAEAVLSVAAEI